MNGEAIHSRAEQLIGQEFVEGISESDRRWLEEHLRECEKCAAAAASTDRALRALKGVSVQVPAGLAEKTKFRVHLRAQERTFAEPRRGILWIACAASWTFGAITAPFVWRALHWVGDQMALPRLVPELGFGLWWALPAIVAGAIILAENAKFERQRDGLRQQHWDAE
ncbi:MAG TPA: hypothetical protein VNU84_04640 [Candidatus Acidoferrum sp.]|jgi:hypothetical protein|nr:hypothetical protein [Candidatus Acidoferrum sp.]